jgi:hypothetical protein
MCNANIFRTLRPDEIEVRVQQVVESKAGGAKAVLLLYKNARVDMDLLDEKFGCLGWQREHTFKDGKNYCKVSVYDTEKQLWVSKEDVGVESNTEETKGEASDSFKRACVNLGIGRELYTSPTIFVALNDNEWRKNDRSGKAQAQSWVKFRVGNILYDAERRIIGISIVDSNSVTRFTTGDLKTNTPPQRQRKALTTDDIMDPEVLTKICDWLHKKADGRKLDEVLRANYIIDEETINNITNEYLRIYAS